MELVSMTDAQTGDLFPDAVIACKDPEHGPPLETNRAYWGIRNVNDWSQWANSETAWVLSHERPIRQSGCLEVLKASGWAQCVGTIESLYEMKRTQGRR